MADNRTMAQMLQAPIEGYEDAIVVPPINANNFELKQPLINLVQSNKFTGRQDPHNHLRFFNKVTSTTSRSILTWDDLVSKFINQYFPPSKTTYYRNEIITFYQKPNEAFNEAWERFKGLLRQCPHHGFSELHQLDTFYNSLNSNDQDALDSAAGGNFLDKMPQEGLAIIESKSKVRYSRSRANDSRVSTDAPLSISSPSNNSFDMQQIAASLEDKMTIKMNQMMSQMKALVTTPAPVKAVEENQMANVTSLLTSLCDNFKNSASTSNTGTLPSQTVTNPRQQINAITTRSEIGLKRCSTCRHAKGLNKWLSSLLRNKEKLEEIAITTVNAECSAIIMNKVPEKLEDPGKFLIPCALQELKRTSALADSGASINLLPYSIYKKT
ncbi:reverse transcriptase domain-containing protein [Tanacetum coccineum]